MPHDDQHFEERAHEAWVIPSATRVAILLLAGIVSGILAWSMSYSGSSALIDLATWPAIYIVAVALIAYLSRGARFAAVSAVSIFLPFVVAYYTATFIAFHTVDWAYAVIWLIASLLLGPGAAGLNIAASWRTSISTTVSGALAALTMVDGSLRAMIDEGIGAPVAGQLFVDLICAVVIILAWNHSAKSRLAAAAVFVPVAIAVLILGSVAHYGIDPFEYQWQWTRFVSG